MIEFIERFGGKIRCEAVPSILAFSHNEFNKFNTTGARMQDSIHHLTLKWHLIYLKFVYLYQNNRIYKAPSWFMK